MLLQQLDGARYIWCPVLKVSKGNVGSRDVVYFLTYMVAGSEHLHVRYPDLMWTSYAFQVYHLAALHNLPQDAEGHA